MGQRFLFFLFSSDHGYINYCFAMRQVDLKEFKNVEIIDNSLIKKNVVFFPKGKE
jgi:hypothetical protein